MTAGNLNHINLLKIGCLFMLIYSFIVVNKNKNYCNLKDIDMLISPMKKFIVFKKFIEDVALLTKIFLGKNANLVNFIWLVKYFLNAFALDFNLRKNVFQIDLLPSFLIWQIIFQCFSGRNCFWLM